MVFEMIPHLNNFIMKYSPTYKPNIKNQLIYFENWLKKFKNKDNILDADYSDIFDFFKNDLNSRGNKSESNRKWRVALNNYYEYIREFYLKSNLGNFTNPVPTSRFFQFDKSKDDLDSDFEQKFLKYDVIEKVLKFFYFTDFSMFIVVSLLAYTGGRISEIISIMIKDVDLENRKIISGRTPGFSKAGKVVIFIPQFFVKQLNNYIENNPFIDEFLFQTESNQMKKKYGFIQGHTIRKKLRKVKKILNINVPINPHAFRDAINTERKEIGCSLEDRQNLLNQKPNTVNTIFYLKRFRNWKPLREKYDQYFPYPNFSV